MPASTAVEQEWISGLKARKLMGGVSYSTLARQVVLGRVRTRLEVGCPPMYNADDARRVATGQQQSADSASA